jgi:altronate dehydratase
LADESSQTVAGVQTIATLMSLLDSAGLTDRVLFASLNVFGRTLGPGNTDGRQHNENHQVSITIGNPIKGGVVGGLAPIAKDYGATAIDSKTGLSSASGDIAAVDTLASYGQTLLAAVGVDAATIASQINSGKVVSGMLT